MVQPANFIGAVLVLLLNFEAGVRAVERREQCSIEPLNSYAKVNSSEVNGTLLRELITHSYAEENENIGRILSCLAKMSSCSEKELALSSLFEEVKKKSGVASGNTLYFQKFLSEDDECFGYHKSSDTVTEIGNSTKTLLQFWADALRIGRGNVTREIFGFAKNHEDLLIPNLGKLVKLVLDDNLGNAKAGLDFIENLPTPRQRIIAYPMMYEEMKRNNGFGVNMEIVGVPQSATLAYRIKESMSDLGTANSGEIAMLQLTYDSFPNGIKLLLSGKPVNILLVRDLKRSLGLGYIFKDEPEYDLLACEDITPAFGSSWLPTPTENGEFFKLEEISTKCFNGQGNYLRDPMASNFSDVRGIEWSIAPFLQGFAFAFKNRATDRLLWVEERYESEELSGWRPIKNFVYPYCTKATTRTAGLYWINYGSVSFRILESSCKNCSVDLSEECARLALEFVSQLNDPETVEKDFPTIAKLFNVIRDKPECLQTELYMDKFVSVTDEKVFSMVPLIRNFVPFSLQLIQKQYQFDSIVTFIAPKLISEALGKDVKNFKNIDKFIHQLFFKRQHAIYNRYLFEEMMRVTGGFDGYPEMIALAQRVKGSLMDPGTAELDVVEKLAEIVGSFPPGIRTLVSEKRMHILNVGMVRQNILLDFAFLGFGTRKDDNWEVPERVGDLFSPDIQKWVGRREFCLGTTSSGTGYYISIEHYDVDSGEIHLKLESENDVVVRILDEPNKQCPGLGVEIRKIERRSGLRFISVSNGKFFTIYYHTFEVNPKVLQPKPENISVPFMPVIGAELQIGNELQHWMLIDADCLDKIEQYGDLENGTDPDCQEIAKILAELKIPTRNQSDVEMISSLIAYTTLNENALGVIAISTVGTVSLAVFIGIVIYQRQKIQVLSKEQIRNFKTGNKIMRVGEGQTSVDDDEDGQEENILGQKYNSAKYEIRKRDFKKESSKLVGTGNFGLVFKSRMDRFGEEVAVKMTKTTICGDQLLRELTSLLREIKVMSFVGEHENVLKLLGAYTKEIGEGYVLVVTEFCENGSLSNYLQGLSKEMNENMRKELYYFCREIACGMAYLAEKRVVHADLAARNVLLNSNNVCKISDFGLSRNLERYEYYQMQDSELLPWRWMALEVLEGRKLTLKGDVWSMGVTFWEIFTLGEQPFVGLSWNVEFNNSIRNGLRLPKPNSISQEVFDVVASCWNLEPGDRPDAQEVFYFFCNAISKEVYTTLVES